MTADRERAVSSASETPESDASEFRYDETGVPIVPSSVARSLERRLREAEERFISLESSNSAAFSALAEISYLLGKAIRALKEAK